MSMYHMLHEPNPLTPAFLFMLDIDQPDDNYKSNRLRDFFVNEDGTRIVMLTRCGDGNRPNFFDERLKKHPNYVRDWDDSFDHTYAFIEFTVPAEYADIVTPLATGKPVPTMKQLSNEAIARLKGMSREEAMNDPKIGPFLAEFKKMIDDTTGEK